MKILIVPDLGGWIVEDMAFNIMRVLDKEFEFVMQVAEKEEGRDVFTWDQDLDRFDLIYLMLPSYVPVNIPGGLEKKVITTFHGGPASEGQGDHIQRAGFRDMRMSYVSQQTNDRISTNLFMNTKKERIPKEYYKISYDELEGKKKVTIDVDNEHELADWIRNGLLQLQEGETYQIIRRPQVLKGGVQELQISYKRRGFGFTNLFFTPHGVNMEDYKQDNIREDFVCGYAGWARYLLNAQRDHRRGYWIMDAQQELGFPLNIAGGIPQYNKQDIKVIKSAYPSNNINVLQVEHDKMQEYYKSISCYLVPDKFAGGPMPVLEAGSMGIPVICTDAGLCGDIIEDGEHGRVVKDYDQFVKAIAWMRDNPDRRKRMGKNLQEYIRKNRTWEAVAPYWAKFFKGVNDEES